MRRGRSEHRVGGKIATTDANGSFVVDAPPVYDAAIAYKTLAGSRGLIVHRGLRRRAPVLVVPESLHAEESMGLAGTGSLSWPQSLDRWNRPQREFEFFHHAEQRCLSRGENQFVVLEVSPRSR